MNLRRAHPDDAEALTRLRLAYLAEDFPARAGELDAIARSLPGYFAEHVGADLRAYVAEEGGAAVSCVLLLVQQKPASPAFPTGRTGTLLNVYTRPEWRRRGLAGALVEMAIADARAEGLSYIELKATRAGARLYEGLGFRAAEPRNRPMILRLAGGE